jgi:hypothetical protein
MDLGLPGLEPKTAASAGRGPETGRNALKKRAGSRQNRLHSGGNRSGAPESHQLGSATDEPEPLFTAVREAITTLPAALS